MHCVLFFSGCDLLCDVQLFSSQVIAFAEQDQEDRLDPLIYVFPRMTKVRLSFRDVKNFSRVSII